MSCDDFRARLLTTSPETLAADPHLEGCADCRALAEATGVRLADLERAFSSFAAQGQPPDVPIPANRPWRWKMTWSTLAVAAAAAGTLFVGGRALNTGTGSSPCADLAALEAPALEGELDEASILCLEGLGSENAERLLAIQHFSSGDMDAWARTVGSLVKRTVEAGTLDPDLGYKYLLHLSAEDRMNPGIPQLVEDVLDASSVWPKPLRIERSNSLLKLATVYALNQWKDGQTDQQRMATGEAARRWFEHSQRHDLEIEKAQELCNLAGADCL